MNENIKADVNNKQLEVKNTVYLYNNELEKLEKIDLSRVKICLTSVTAILGGISYVKNFKGLSFVSFIICIILTITSFSLDIYLKKRVAYLKQRIKELEKFFLELDAKKSEL